MKLFMWMTAAAAFVAQEASAEMNRIPITADLEAAMHSMKQSRMLGATNNNASRALESCNAVIDQDFSNFGTHDGWDDFQGLTNPSADGYQFHASPDSSSSRIRSTVVFGQRDSYIHVDFRGAENAGRNSYVCLREQYCADRLGGNCDEIDIVETYFDGRAEGMFYTRANGGDSPNRGELTSYMNSGAGGYAHKYEMWHWPGQSTVCFQADGGDRHCYGNAPSGHEMRLYVGHWICDGNQDWCGGFTNYDTWMELKYIWACQV